MKKTYKLRTSAVKNLDNSEKQARNVFASKTQGSQDNKRKIPMVAIYRLSLNNIMKVM